jgi:hypothetical protein
MKTEIELQEILTRSRQFNIWANPKAYNKVTRVGDCEYCGKKVGANPLYVHVTYTGTCLPNSVTAEEINDVEESQGSFAIGSGCAKQLFGSELSNYTQS